MFFILLPVTRLWGDERIEVPEKADAAAPMHVQISPPMTCVKGKVNDAPQTIHQTELENVQRLLRYVKIDV